MSRYCHQPRPAESVFSMLYNGVQLLDICVGYSVMFILFFKSFWGAPVYVVSLRCVCGVFGVVCVCMSVYVWCDMVCVYECVLYAMDLFVFVCVCVCACWKLTWGALLFPSPP